MRVLAALALAAALVLPAGAAAKEVTGLEVCGKDGCTRIVDRAVLRAFEQGSDMAAAAPEGAYRSYVVRVHMREGDAGPDHEWTNRWLPAVGLLANAQGKDQFIFTTVTPTLERALRRATRGHTARAARRFAREDAPVARVAEVVPAPGASAGGDDGGGLPALAWIGVAAGLVLVGGAVRARRS